MDKMKYKLVVYNGNTQKSDHEIGPQLEKVLYKMGEYFDGNDYNLNKKHDVVELLKEMEKNKKDLSYSDSIWFYDIGPFFEITPKKREDWHIKVEIEKEMNNSKKKR